MTPARQAVPPCVLLLFVLVLAGCRSVPPPPSGGSGAQQMKAQVRFLAQPRLKGRKPGTHGSRVARDYIESQFEACGLVPWGQAKAFEHPFGVGGRFGYGGRNIVGLLPGSDPELRGEIVLVSAHYDHLGKDSKGRICPGAADNASGVAALLEIALRLSSPEHRPKRSLLFVAFDCEEMMLFGSFAFSCEKAVEQARIVTVINMDMLGRDFFDVVHHAVFVAGAERYPALREALVGFGAQAGIRVLPLGTDLVGPRSDHVAFQSRGVPCLFFSCGTFGDYHEPGDTADKLNYADLSQSADVVLRTVLEVANARAIEPAQPAESGYRAELQTVCTVMTEVNQNRVRAGVKAEDAKAFESLAREAQELLTKDNYDRHSREKLIVEASGILAPYFLPTQLMEKAKGAEAREESKLYMKYLYAFYLRYGPKVMEGYHRLVVQLVKYRPGLVRGMPRFKYELYDIGPEDISLCRRTQDHYVLNSLANSWTMNAEVKSSKWVLKSFNCYMGSSLYALDCEGTLQQLADCCLLRLRSQQTNAEQALAIGKVLRAVQTNDTAAPYQVLLRARLQRGGFKDETDWLVSCITTGTPDLEIEAISAAWRNSDERVEHAVCRVLTNDLIRADVRAAAINWAAAATNRQVFLTLSDLVDNPTPSFKREYLPILAQDYPFSDRPVVTAARAVWEHQAKDSPIQTLGDLARAQLKHVAKKDLGKDPQRWRNWLQSHRLVLHG